MLLAFPLPLLVPTLADVVRRRWNPSPDQRRSRPAAVVLRGTWLYRTLPAISLPAEIFIWSPNHSWEDIVKFRSRYPHDADQVLARIGPLQDAKIPPAFTYR